jgi:uncharacterized UBP type Zn finger protein
MDPVRSSLAIDGRNTPSPLPEEEHFWNSRPVKLLKNCGCCLYELFMICMENLLLFLRSLRDLGENGSLNDLEKRHGAGIYRRGNTCYINSVVQALRFHPPFPPIQQLAGPGNTREEILKHLDKQKELELQAEMRKQLEQLISTLQPGESQRRLKSSEISKFLDYAIEKGFQVQDSRSAQQDASELFTFLMDKIGMPNFKYKLQVLYEFGAPINSLDKTNYEENHISIGIHPGARTSIQELITRNVITETIEKKDLQNSYKNLSPQERKEAGFDKEAKKTVRQMNEKEDVRTLQSIQLGPNPPQILPIVLKRFTHEVKKTDKAVFVELKKEMREIDPSPELTFSLIGENAQTVRYKLKSIIVHIGSSIKSGHYRIYIPHESEQGKYLRFDDADVHSVKAEKYNPEMRQNGYLFFYERQPEPAAPSAAVVG